MAIALTHHATSGHDPDQSAYSSASITPTANRLIVAYFESARAGVDPTVVTAAGNGLSWSEITNHFWNTDDVGANRSKGYIFAADTGASPSAGAVTFTHGGAVNHTYGLWSIYELSGTDLASSGGSSTVAQCFVQVVKTTANTAGTSASPTLAAAGNGANRPFMFVTHFANEVTNPAASWTEIAEFITTTPVRALESQWRSDAFDTAATATWTSNVRHGGISFEIKANAGAPPPPTRKLVVNVSPRRW